MELQAVVKALHSIEQRYQEKLHSYQLSGRAATKKQIQQAHLIPQTQR
jgi:hypothetical protein